MGKPAKILSKEDLLRAMKMTRSNFAAARYLHVSYNHYKKYAKLYKNTDNISLLEAHKNQEGKGIPKFALKASSGDYVIFFGDDDGIIPDQFKHLRYILEEHTPDSLSWDFLTYVWPIEGYGKKTGGLRFEFRKI